MLRHAGQGWRLPDRGCLPPAESAQFTYGADWVATKLRWKLTVDPDGMTVDAEGALWTAVRGTGTVHRYRADGTLDQQIRLPATQPAGLCLDGDTLYVTSARHGLAAPGPLDGAVFAVRVGVPGLPTSVYRPGRAE